MVDNSLYDIAVAKVAAGSSTATQIFHASSADVVPGGINAIALDSVGNVFVAVLAGPNYSPSPAVLMYSASTASTSFYVYPNTFGLVTLPSIAVDPSGNVFVAVSDGTIQKISPAKTIAVLASGFGNPAGLATDSQGSVYIADAGNSGYGQVIKISAGGAKTVLASGLSLLSGIAVDSSFHVYAYSNGHIIQIQPGNLGRVYTFGGLGLPSSPFRISLALRGGC